MRSMLGLLAFVATVALAGPVAADKGQCVAAHAESQISRKSGKLRATQASLLVCSRPECPSLVASDCTSWMSEVRAEQPSIVISALDERGQQTLEVRVLVDGDLAAGRLDGNPIDVDPGEHVLRCELASGKAIESRVVLSVGEKARPLRVDFASQDVERPVAAGAVIAKELVPASGPEPIRPAPRRSVPTLAWVLGGAGVAAAGTFAVFGLMGDAERSDLESQKCTPRCSPAAVSIAYRDDLVADISLGVSLVAIGVAAGITIAAFMAPRPRSAVGASPVSLTLGGAAVEF